MRLSYKQQILKGLVYVLGAAILGLSIGIATASFLVDIEKAMDTEPPQVTWPEFHAPAIPATRE